LGEVAKEVEVISPTSTTMGGWGIVAGCAGNSSDSCTGNIGFRPWDRRHQFHRFGTANGYVTVVFMITGIIKVGVVEVTCSCPLVNKPFDFVGTLDVRWANTDTCWLGGLSELQYQGIFNQCIQNKPEI
jgi:hypothetical protein